MIATSSLSGDIIHVELTDGRRLGISQVDYETLGSNGFPTPRSLLLAGTKPSLWWVSVRPAGRGYPAGCFLLGGTATQRDDSLEFDMGIRLMKAPSFTSTLRSGDHFGGDVCLDTQGRVMSIYRGGQ